MQMIAMTTISSTMVNPSRCDAMYQPCCARGGGIITDATASRKRAPKPRPNLVEWFGPKLTRRARVTELLVRRLLIDLETPFARRWCRGDAFLSALFNALSMSFPIGEQFFIDAVKSGHRALPPQLQEKFKAEVQGFIGQEATHRRIHALVNAQLARQGLVNEWE